MLDPGSRLAIEHLLHAARRRLGMEAAFLAEITATEQLYRAATAEAGSFTILQGGSLPRLESYCQEVLERGGPWVVRDAAEDPVASKLAITGSGRFGSYIGVPVRLEDGTVFGTLCCISHDPRPDLGDGHVAVLEAFADVLAFQLSQLAAAQEETRFLREVGGEFADRARASERQAGLLSEVVSASRTPMAVFDPVDLSVEYCNEAAAEVLGTTTDRVIGTPFWRHTTRWTEAAMREELGPVLRGDVPSASFDVQVPRAGGRVLHVVAQHIDPKPGSPSILLTGHDITERRRSQDRLERALQLEQEAGEELRRLDSMRNAFLTAISHELRTPLTSLRLAAETLHAGRVPEEMAGHLLERLMANADRLDRLLADLLDLNRFSHGALELVRHEVRVDEVVAEAVAQVELDHHTVRLELEPVEGRVAPTKVERIVVNLVLNAAVHTPGGTITVRLRGTDDGALLVVEDEGDGVPAPDRERLFEPFRQGATVPSHRPGTGIGLSLVAAFAELHGGRAWIDEADGGGAAFQVLLPLTEG